MKSPALEPEVRPEPTRLLIVLGVQVTAIGLLGEIIIFFSSKRETPEFGEVLTLPEDEVSQTHAGSVSASQPR